MFPDAPATPPPDESTPLDAAEAKKLSKREKQRLRDKRRPNRKGKRLLIGIDGEGHDLPDGSHVYTYLAAVTDDGKLVGEASNPKGLTHDECMAMLLSLPQNSLCVGYSIGYDVTKWLEGLAPIDRYLIARPEHRQSPLGFARHHRVGQRMYDVFTGSFSVKDRTTKRQRTVWDVFRFFGTAFVVALDKWKIGTEEQRERVRAMKGKRNTFAAEKPDEVAGYCREECHLLAMLMRKLITEHEGMGLRLQRYTGPGATANALLKREGVAAFLGPRLDELPPELADAIMRAFFGGRFEHAVVGPVREPVHSYDLSSAYASCATSMPCLACGTWRRIEGSHDEVERHASAAALAVCAFEVGRAPRGNRAAWGPLPRRDDEGAIVFPWNFRGHAWFSEVKSAMALHPGLVKLSSAWLYETTCEHRPFGWVPNVYRDRVRMGSDGAGLVLKLGLSAATYGKLAQSKGNGAYTSYVWAGAIVAGVRARLLDAIASAENPWDVLAVATDGLHARKPLVLPKAIDPATADLEKPLGGWTHEVFEEGAMFVRPGLVYRYGGNVEQVRARGVGRAELHRSMSRIDSAWRNASARSLTGGVQFPGDRRFYGLKTSILGHSGCRDCGTAWPGTPSMGCPKCGRCGTRFAIVELREGGTPDGRTVYGRWIARPVRFSFDPSPKRIAKLPPKPRDGYVRLEVPDARGAESHPYTPGNTTPQGRDAATAKQWDLEQPDYPDPDD